eukprot:COSAG05_NODE_22749_length_262_cov_1.263804_1_plen_81_part_01
MICATNPTVAEPCKVTAGQQERGDIPLGLGDCVGTAHIVDLGALIGRAVPLAVSLEGRGALRSVILKADLVDVRVGRGHRP